MLIFLYGQDSFRSRLKLNELKDKYLREVDPTGSGLNIIDGSKASFGDIAQAVSPSSLLAKKRLVVVENIFSNKEAAIFDKLGQYFEKQAASDNIVIFWETSLKIKKVKNQPVAMLIDAAGREKPLAKKAAGWFKFLARQKYVFNFNLLNNAELADWTRKQVEARGGKISAAAASQLVGLVGQDGWQLNNEIDKLISYKSAGQLTAGQTSIEAADIKTLVQGVFSENIFALTDALSAKNKSLAIKLLAEQIEAGLEGAYLLNMFVRQFKILLQTKQALEAGSGQRQIASQLKLHPFVAQKAVEQAGHFTLPFLKNILSRLAKIDFQVKSGKIDYATGLNMLIVKI